MNQQVIFQRKAKDIMSNMDNDELKNEFFEWYQENISSSDHKTVDSLLRYCVTNLKLYIEDMAEHYPGRKHYYLSILENYDNKQND